jgi:PAS domain S-box-containing protein
MARALIEQRPIHGYEAIAERPDGTRADFIPYPTPLFDPAGKLVGGVDILVDITDRKRADEDLRESEQRFRMLFDSMEEGCCVIEVIFDNQKRPIDYRFININPAFERQTGLKSARGKLMRELVPDHEQHWFDIYGEIALTGKMRRFENKAQALNRWYEVCAFRMDSAGLPYVGIVFNDVTERRRISEERQAMLDSERAARSEAERAGRMKDEFLATLSHELRTPLNAILGYATIMRVSALDEARTKEAIETIERNARIQAQLIQDLLDMNAIISGKVRLEMQRINIGQVIEEAIKTVRPSAEMKSIRLNVLLDSPAVPVRADPNRIQQVVWNLLSNAIKFTPRGGKVQVWLNPINSYVELTVTDSGSGISADFLPYVFDRFRQADGSLTRRHGGLGLGLAIAKQIVELHGGTIRAESGGENKGARP